MTKDAAPTAVEKRGAGETTAPLRVRLPWVDAARGYCVVAVVAFHVLSWWTLGGQFSVAPRAASFLTFVDSLLGSLRMPLLLAVSGLVVSRQVREGLHRSTTVFRTATNAYLYVVWLVVYALFFALVGTPGLPDRIDGPVDALKNLVIPGTTLWYLFALALYIPVLALVHRVPSWLVLAALLVLSLVVYALHPPGAFAPRVLELWLFFALGVYGAPWLRSAADRVGWAAVLCSAGVAVIVTLFVQIGDESALVGVRYVARDLSYMVTAVLAVARLSRWRPFERLGVLLGRHTLPLYVLHPLAVYGLVSLSPGVAGVLAGVWGSEIGSLLFPPLVVTAVVVLCRLVEIGTRSLHLTALWGLPAFARRALGR